MTAPTTTPLRGDGIRVHRAEDGGLVIQITSGETSLVDWQVRPLRPGESVHLGPLAIQLDVTLLVPR